MSLSLQSLSRHAISGKKISRRQHDPFQENHARDDFKLDDRPTSLSRAHARLANSKLTYFLLSEESDRKSDKAEKFFLTLDNMRLHDEIDRIKV